VFVVHAIVAMLVAAALLASAGAKLTRQEAVVMPLTGIGVPLDWFRQLAAVEIAGAIGLLAGLFVPAIGIAAAIGVILHFRGAVSFHVRADDTALARPVVIGLLGVAASSSRPSESRGPTPGCRAVATLREPPWPRATLMRLRCPGRLTVPRWRRSSMCSSCSWWCWSSWSARWWSWAESSPWSAAPWW
jgi:hypothetical protein